MQRNPEQCEAYHEAIVDCALAMNVLNNRVGVVHFKPHQVNPHIMVVYDDGTKVYVTWSEARNFVREEYKCPITI